ncbi:CusA/CzcA family heavy metal efflux RND transporter [Massilia sp. CCM 8695]|uniref:CusA/CzcA family heavy metal efflux RND transporter n=1 Tax=Massilia frigida TaxID=2609281 RepID=A0ABX0NA24_9BURK|nr:efflux RND transporter permease subunit [Massilia frigida]NHZ82276.1 CusA/CzcA family heavy metal efflux RND transporter [Massilia frigida]
MISKIIEWSLKNRLFVLLAGLILLVWGGWQTTRMPVDVFPDLTAPAVTIVTEAHGMAPTEVEAQVTFPVETAMNGASGVRRVRSVSDVGISIVTVEFDWGTDIYLARQIVAEKLQLARSALPPDIPPPVMAPVASVMGEIMFVALTSDHHPGTELKTTADWVLRKRILAVPGVAEVIPIGGDTKQFQVIVQPDKLAAYGITLADVTAALRASNQNASAGFYTESAQEYLIQGLGRIRGEEDIADTAVAMRNGQPVLVRHLASVKIGAAPKRGTGSFSGKPAVILGIQKQPGANTLELTRRLDVVFADMQAALPKGMTINSRVFRQADFISTSVENLMAALRDGAILVVLIVFGFLLSARATAITLIALPLSLVVATLSMKAMGATINTMTLGGLAIALGALVDDAIIVVENIVRRLRENNLLAPAARLAPPRVVLDATREIQGSIVFATLIIMLVFLPLFFLTGVEGRLMVPLGYAYVVALAASLGVALTVTPVLALWLLPTAKIVTSDQEPRFLHSLKQGYGQLLSSILLRWKSVAVVSGALLAAALVALAFTGRAFLPDFNEGSLTVSAVTLPGTALDESDRLARRVEQILMSQPEVTATARRTGRAELDPHDQGINASEIDVSLSMKDRSKDALLAALRKEFATLPGMNVVIGQPISHRIDHMLSGTRANIAVKIFGADLYELRKAGDQIKAVAETVPGAVDVSVEQQIDIPFVNIRFKRDALARAGMSVQSVAEAIETAFSGQVVSRILDGQTSFDLAVRYDPAVSASLEAINATLITTPSGARLPLSALADIRKDRGPNLIGRENVQRKIVVMANVSGRDLAGVVDEMRRRVQAEVKLPVGYHVEYGGQFESAEGASRTLLVLGSAVLVGIFLLLFMAFRSTRDALLVMVNLPLAMIGGVVGVYVTGGVLSVAAIIGFITLFGIATRNGVMMISHIRHLIDTGVVTEPIAAIRRGAEERLVPILMTALAAGLALVPLALSAGKPGSEIQAPMAVVILFGLLTSTALNMFVVPALYLRFGSHRATAGNKQLPDSGQPGEQSYVGK